MPPQTHPPYSGALVWDNTTYATPDTFQTLNAVSLAPPYHGLTSKHTRRTKSRAEEEDVTTPMTPKKGFTFGCDPEGFIFKGDKPIPAAEAGIPGTKESPCKLFGDVAVQVDGMAAEFNIPPVNNYDDWEGYITLAVDQLKSLLPEGLELRFTPTARFDQETFDRADDYSKQLGCMPDVDAWSGGMNPPPNLDEDPYLRCAGGHLHVGWTENELLSDVQHILNCQDLTKQFDWFLGAWSVLEDPDPVRRQLYGKVGACRYKPYGVEYRVLSSFWVNTKELRLAVWNRMNAAINAMANCYMPEKLPKTIHDRLKTSINAGQKDDQLLAIGHYPIQTLQYANRQF